MYKRIFTKKVASVAFLFTLLLTVGECATGVLAGVTSLFEYFDLSVRFILSLFLFVAYMKHNLMAIQGGCTALLLSLVYSQGAYLFNDLLYMGAEDFVNLGFWGAFYLAGELMLMIWEMILTANHFFLFVLKQKNFLRVSVNQLTTIVMLAFQLFQAFVVAQITLQWRDLAYYDLFSTSLIFVFVLILCAEQTLATDDEESKG